MAKCLSCQRELIPLDMSFSMKLLGRGIQEYYCTDCLCKKLNLTNKDLKNLADLWHRQECSLFDFDPWPPKELIELSKE